MFTTAANLATDEFYTLQKTIRNGVIVTKHPYRGNQGNNSQPNSNHQQRSETQN